MRPTPSPRGTATGAAATIPQALDEPPTTNTPDTMEEILQQLAAIQQTQCEMQIKQEKIEAFTLIAAKPMLDINDVAVLTGFSVPYIYRLTSQHKIPYYKPNGKSIYFDRSELEAWMKQNRVNTTDEAAQIAAQHLAQLNGNKARAAASTNRKPAGARK